MVELGQMFAEFKGTKGQACDMPSACKLMDYLKEWETSADPAGRRKAWDEILAANADEVFSIGSSERDSPTHRRRTEDSGNVPKEGYYAWDPGGYIGLYQPDTFWIDQ